MGARVTAELLKAAMNDAGVDVDMLADRVQVDVRTVRRWVRGGIPYARHQTRIARALNTTARDLWPEAHPNPEDSSSDDDGGGSDGAGVESRGPLGSADVVAISYGRDDPNLPDAHDLLADAQTRIDLLDVTLTAVITGADAVQLLAEKTEAGCAVRILISDPDSAHLTTAALEVSPELPVTHQPELSWAVQRTIGYLQPLLDLQHVDVRMFVAERVNLIVRVEDEMLVTLALRGVSSDYEPVLHLRRRSENGVFDRFAHHYESIWTHAATPLAADPDSYPDPDEHPTATGPTRVRGGRPRSGRSMRSTELHRLHHHHAGDAGADRRRLNPRRDALGVHQEHDPAIPVIQPIGG